MMNVVANLTLLFLPKICYQVFTATSTNPFGVPGFPANLNIDGRTCQLEVQKIKALPIRLKILLVLS